jgi:hypothetical protein
MKKDKPEVIKGKLIMAGSGSSFAWVGKKKKIYLLTRVTFKDKVKIKKDEFKVW